MEVKKVADFTKPDASNCAFDDLGNREISEYEDVRNIVSCIYRGPFHMGMYLRMMADLVIDDKEYGLRHRLKLSEFYLDVSDKFYTNMPVMEVRKDDKA